MSLYRTWRPKSFADLVGQDAVVRTLRTALESGKLAHAYLFSGPRGSGKTSAAKIMARCIDCVLGPTAEPDNTCENCLAMLAGTALDVVEIDAASNRGIDEIRALRDSAKFAPSSMRMKVFIIDEAHMLTREGANAFLKTLEEPPPHVVFILATTAPESLPPTILSRCQRYAFRRIPVGVMVDRMREISSAEDIAADEGALAAIAYRADGGLRDALTMLEQVAAYAGPPGTAVSAETVDAAFGITGRHYARGIVAAILAEAAGDALRLVDEASDAGADMLGLIRGAIGEYRNLLVARVDPALLSSDLAPSDSQAAIALSKATPQPKIVRGLRLLADALAAGRLSGNPRLELETAILRLVMASEDTGLEALATRVALLESGHAAVPARGPAAAAAASADTRAAADAAAPAANAAAPAAKALSATTEPVAPRRRAAGSAAAAAGVPERAAPAAPIMEPAEPAAAPAVEPPPFAVPEPEKSAGEHEPAASAVPEAAAAAVALESAAVKRSEPPSDLQSEGAPAVVRAPVVAPREVSLQQVRSLWDQIRLRAEETHKPLKGPLSSATVDNVADGAVTIGVSDSIAEAIVRGKLEALQSAVNEVLRTPLRIVLRSRMTAGSQRANAAATSGASASIPATSAHRAQPMPGDHAASAADSDGEIDLLAYARKKIGGTEKL